MIQYTTPTVRVRAHGADLTSYSVKVTFDQGGTKVTVDDPPAEYDSKENITTFLVPLTQEQTGKFRKGEGEVQINWFDGATHRDATLPGKFKVGKNLLPEVI